MTYYWTSTQGAWGSTTVVTYPCDRGMGRGGVTYHDFTANAAGVAVCRFCGARPGGKSRRRKFPRPRTWSPRRPVVTGGGRRAQDPHPTTHEEHEMTDLNLVDFAPRLAERIPEDADVFSIEINPSPAFHDDEHFAIHLDGDREEIDRVAGAIFGHPIGDEWTNGVSLYGRTGMYGGWRVLVWGTDR